MAALPRSDTRALLLEHGLRLARQGGLRRLTVRGVCAAADVNPGSFVYHFRTRDHFVAELIEQVYAPLFTRMQANYSQSGAPLERLRAMLVNLLQFVVALDSVLAQFILDAIAGEAPAMAFMRGVDMRHPQLLLRCIAEAQAAGELRRDAPEHQLLFLMAAIGLPAVLRGLVADRPMLPKIFRDALHRYAVEPQAVEQRLDWALQGLRPPRLETHS